jgi:transposase
VYAVYEACGFGFCLQRQLSALAIECHVVCPQKLDELAKRVKTDSLDAKALCLRLDRFLQGNRAALALVRVPSEEEEQARALHRQREQLVKVRKVLEAQGRSLLVNHGVEPVQQWWWKKHAFAALSVPHWIRVLLQNTQPILLLLLSQIDQLTLQLQNAATAQPPRGLGKMTSVIIDREIGDWHRFNNRRQTLEELNTMRRTLLAIGFAVLLSMMVAPRGKKGNLYAPIFIHAWPYYVSEYTEKELRSRTASVREAHDLPECSTEVTWFYLHCRVSGED